MCVPPLELRRAELSSSCTAHESSGFASSFAVRLAEVEAEAEVELAELEAIVLWPILDVYSALVFERSWPAVRRTLGLIAERS